MFCSECGNEVNDNARFCNNCGVSLIDDEPKQDAHQNASNVYKLENNPSNTKEKKMKQKPSKPKKNRHILLTIFFVICLIIMIICVSCALYVYFRFVI